MSDTVYAKDLGKFLGSKKVKTVRELAQIVGTRPDDNQTHCLFMGAGCSRSSGISTGEMMVEKWRTQVYEDIYGSAAGLSREEIVAAFSRDHADWYDKKNEYASFIEKNYPLPRSRRAFIEMEVVNNFPSIGYSYLVRISESGYLKTFFTTNFDDLLNEAFYQFSSERPLVCAHDSTVNSISVTSRRAKILKLHGDYLFDSIKNTELETSRIEKNMDGKMSEFLKEYGLILVGYSGGDRSVMGIIDKLLLDDNYINNGLYWCFRRDDVVSDEVVGLLRNKKSFLVLIDGFDEVMAELHNILNGPTAPFNKKIASDRASKIIESYLDNGSLVGSSSAVIKRHMDELRNDKTSSLISDALAAINTEEIASAGLTDNDFLVILEIESAVRANDPERALRLICDGLRACDDGVLKELLLAKRMFCAGNLYRMNEVRESIDELIGMDDRNLPILIGKCDLLDGRAERIDMLRELMHQHPYSFPLINRYVSELRRSVIHKDKCSLSVEPRDIIDGYERSIGVFPSIGNPAWSSMFGYLMSDFTVLSDKEAKLVSIIDEHLKQDSYSPATCNLIYKYCKKYEKTEYSGRSLFEYLTEAYRKQFPRDYASHLNVMVEACCEYGNFAVLKESLEEARSHVELEHSESFTSLLMRVQYDIYRDIGAAIKTGEEFLVSHSSVSIKKHLFELYIDNDDLAKAGDMLSSIKGSVSLVAEMELRSSFYDKEGRIQDAIDYLENIPDKREFDERYTSRLSFLEMKLGDYKKAYSRLRKFLDARSYSGNFSIELINHEFSGMKIGKKAHPKRLNAIIEKSEDRAVVAVATLLLGRRDEAMDILVKEGERKFSHVLSFREWPVLGELSESIEDLYRRLLRSRRSLDSLGEK